MRHRILGSSRVPLKALLYKSAETVADVLTDRTIQANTPAVLPGEDEIQTLEKQYEAGDDDGNKDDDEEMKEEGEEEENWDEVYKGDRVAKKVGYKIYFGTVIQFGFIEKDGEDSDAWCIEFDKKIVTYINSSGKGYKEDFTFEELEAAIEPYQKHEDENK